MCVSAYKLWFKSILYNIAFIASEFLKNTATQLTYYGLDLLLDSIPVDTLCVLFRNNHVSFQLRSIERK